MNPTPLNRSCLACRHHHQTINGWWCSALNTDITRTPTPVCKNKIERK